MVLGPLLSFRQAVGWALRCTGLVSWAALLAVVARWQLQPPPSHPPIPFLQAPPAAPRSHRAGGGGHVPVGWCHALPSC